MSDKIVVLDDTMLYAVPQFYSLAMQSPTAALEFIQGLTPNQCANCIPEEIKVETRRRAALELLGQWKAESFVSFAADLPPTDSNRQNDNQQEG